MALGAVVAAALTDHSFRRAGLWLGGVDVLKEPGSQADYGVPLGSIEVEEAGPGGVSSLTFTISDWVTPTIEVTEGMDVQYWDYQNDIPLFRGWVQTWSYIPDFGQQGRRIRVVCVGIEVLLDWAIIPSLTLPGGLVLPNYIAVQMAATAAGVALNFGADPTNRWGNQATPVGVVHTGILLQDAMALTAVTLREAIRQIWANQIVGTTLQPQVTVDFYGGLRTWRGEVGGGGGTGAPDDYTTWQIVDTPVAGPIKATRLEHEVDASGIVRAVYVVGGNAAGTGWVSDGTGKIGPTAVLNDDTILNATTRDAVGGAYLASFAVALRGTFDQVDHPPVPGVRAGGIVEITDFRAGQNVNSYMIGSITKTFTGSRQTWSVRYGGLAPSAMRSVRRLTRDTLS